jgi:hypothetical protein
VQKREKKRQNVTATHRDNPANALKYCELPNDRASYTILPETSMAWRRFHGASVLVTTPVRLTTNCDKLSDLGFFEFVHNVRKRGKALLGALIELLLSQAPGIQ